MSRKCLKVSYEFLEDLFGIARQNGKISAVENEYKTNSLKIYFEDDEKDAYAAQGMEAEVVQILMTYK